MEKRATTPKKKTPTEGAMEISKSQAELLRKAIVLHTAKEFKKWHQSQWQDIRAQWPEVLSAIDWKRGVVKEQALEALNKVAPEETLEEIASHETLLEKRAKFCYGPAYSEFFDAITEDNTSKIREMVSKGIPVRQEGGEYGNLYRDFPLIHAIRKDSLKAAELLLKLGCSPNAPKFNKKEKKVYLSEPVREAASAGNRILVDLLLDYGAAVPDQTEADGKTTIVTLAAKAGNLGLVSRLKSKMKEYVKFKDAIESGDAKEAQKYFKLGYKPWEVEKRSLLKGLLSKGSLTTPLITSFLSINQKGNELVAKVPALKGRAASLTKICLDGLEEFFTKNDMSVGIFFNASKQSGQKDAGEIRMDFPTDEAAKLALKKLRELPLGPNKPPRKKEIKEVELS